MKEITIGSESFFVGHQSQNITTPVKEQELPSSKHHQEKPQREGAHDVS
jgi:hypothetical protein